MDLKDSGFCEKLQDATDFIEGLVERGLIKQSTWKDALINRLAEGKRTYLGIDPTADFLHLGHYLGLSLLKRFTNHEYPIVVLIGSLTARIGDPSFRSTARKFNPNIDQNAIVLKEQLQIFFKDELDAKTPEGLPLCEIVDNYELHNFRFKSDATVQEKPINVLLTFINESCSCLKINELIKKDIFENRLKTGLTLAEFLYPCLQGLDFLHLYREKDVAIQLGGSDQWGNMLVGLELMSNDSDYEEDEYEDKVPFKKAGVITFPLLTDSGGNKFGKSEGNAISINVGEGNKNIYAVRQYLLNVSDDCVKDLFLKLTHLTIDEIKQIMNDLDVRGRKNKLAETICGDIFSFEEVETSTLITKQIFSGLATQKTYEELRTWGQLIPSKDLKWVENMQLSSIFVTLDLISSNSEFNRLKASKGVYVSGASLEDLEKTNYLIKENYVVWDTNNPLRGILVVRKGKKQWGLIHFSKDESVFS